MAGTGFNYIREIMQMNLPEESTPYAIKEYEREEKAKKFHYIGITPYMPYDHNCTVKLMPAGMAGVIACNKDELTTYNASVNDVVQHCGRLYTYTPRGHWAPFVPGPCTDYDGPNPYEKKVMVSTAPSIDSPLAEMIREKTNILMDQLGIGYDAPSAIEHHGNMVTFNYNIKYIGETVNDIVNKPKKRNIDILLRNMDPYVRVHFAQIGNVVTYKGVVYIYTGENDGWKVFEKKFQPNNKEENNMAISMRYLGKSTIAICNESTDCRVRINGEIVRARPGDLAMYDFELYAFIEDNPMKLPSWKKIGSIEFDKLCRYDKVKPNWLAIDKVVFNAPATIVFWKDGTKSIVKCGDNEVFDPEKGLAMAITKKAFGNQGNYYNQIKKFLPTDYVKLEEIMTSDPAQEYMDSVRDLITDMALNGATKADLVRAIRFSKEIIDGFKATPDEKPGFNPLKLEKDYGIAALREKYQKPKKTK
jgi:hypothetical protein